MARNLADFELSGPSYMVWVIPITDPSEDEFGGCRVRELCAESPPSQVSLYLT